MSSKYLKFKVVDRKDKVLCTIEEYTSVLNDSSTVGELMKLIIKKSDSLCKYKSKLTYPLFSQKEI